MHTHFIQQTINQSKQNYGFNIPNLNSLLKCAQIFESLISISLRVMIPPSRFLLNSHFYLLARTQHTLHSTHPLLALENPFSSLTMPLITLTKINGLVKRKLVKGRINGYSRAITREFSSPLGCPLYRLGFLTFPFHAKKEFWQKKESLIWFYQGLNP